MSDVGVFFGGERAPCVGASAASMAAMRHVWQRLPRWKVRDINSDSPEALLWSLPMVEDGVVLRERGKSWWASASDGRGSVWSCRSCFSGRGSCPNVGFVAVLVELPSPFPLRHGVVLS
jgi:hypothetical protein